MAIRRLELWLVVAMLAGVPVAGWAQQFPEQFPVAGWPRQGVNEAATGTVAGYVYCADTDKPGRFAWVTIEPVGDFNAVKTDAEGKIVSSGAYASTMTVQTGSDGKYLIEHVPAGQYYIIVELPGYLTPLTEFSQDDFDGVEEDTEKRVRATLRAITVLNGQKTRADFRLDRGAVISGKVIYDDGSVVANAYVKVLRRKKDGTWEPVSDLAQSRFSGFIKTDDRGRYRISMLRSGEYVVEVDLQRILGTAMTWDRVLPRIFQAPMFDPARSTRVYSGSTTRMSEAKSITVRGDDERSDVDITIPLSKMYTVTGAVISAIDGHAVDSAEISLKDTTDGSTIQSHTLGSGRFRLEDIPDGRYQLVISEPNDRILETGTTEKGQIIYSPWVIKRKYEDAEQTLEVHKDLSGVTVKVFDLTDKKEDQSTAANH